MIHLDHDMMMHATCCVKRPNGVGMVFTDRNTLRQTEIQTHRQNENVLSPQPLRTQ